jgi:hypothetical protein
MAEPCGFIAKSRGLALRIGITLTRARPTGDFRWASNNYASPNHRLDQAVGYRVDYALMCKSNPVETVRQYAQKMFIDAPAQLVKAVAQRSGKFPPRIEIRV